jgi:hypothetical protein
MDERRDILKLAPRPAAETYWLHVSRAAMACKFEVTLPQSAQAGVRVASAALDEIARLEQQLTSFRADSEVCFINQCAATEAVQVEAALFALLSIQYKDGREVFDHVFATLEYPGGRSATFSSIESNAFEDHYEMFMGTKGTLILQNEIEVYLFYEGEAAATQVAVTRQTAAPVADTSATRPAEAQRTVNAATAGQIDRNISYRNEIAEFCASVRTGKPVRCGPEKAMRSAQAVFTANRAAEKGQRLELTQA